MLCASLLSVIMLIVVAPFYNEKMIKNFLKRILHILDKDSAEILTGDGEGYELLKAGCSHRSTLFWNKG